MALLAPWLAPYRPDLVDVTQRLLPPSSAHWLGTDTLGRDVLSRLLYGARVSLFVSILVVLLGAAFGILVGGIAAYAGGWVEHALMRFTDLVLCFPPIILAMAIAAALGIGTVNTMIAMLVVWWPKFARLARGLVLVQRHQEYVEAAHVIGYGPGRVLLKHIMPNAHRPADRAGARWTSAMRSSCSRDCRSSGWAWCRRRRNGVPWCPKGRELVDQWWCATFAGLAIFTVVMGFNFLGDGIRDWLDPRARRR